MNQTKNNVYDKLLYYLSHEGQVSWKKFKEAVEKLANDQQHYNPFTYLMSLGRLGHLDYDPMELLRVAIAITPAVLIDTTVENRYVLIGSRTPAFLEEIKQCVSDTGGRWHTKINKYAPTTIFFSDLTDVSLTKIESLGIHISWSFSAKLSTLLPKPKYTSFSQQTETAFTNSVKKFNLQTLEFKPDNQRLRGNGLYEIPQYGPNVYILKFGSSERKVPRDWGIWLALSNAGKTTGLVSYEEETRRWCIKRSLQLPPIIDRCATLCSGFPPKLLKKNDCYYYSDVPIGIAYELTKSLHQTWEIVDV